MKDINELLAALSQNLQELAKIEAIQGAPESRELISIVSRDLVTIQKGAKTLLADKERLEAENYQLRAQLAGEHGFDVKDKVYYTPDGDGPFCPFCYENRRRKQRLRPVDAGSGAVRHVCRICESKF